MSNSTGKTPRIKIGNVLFRFFGTRFQGRLLVSQYPSGNTRLELEVRDMHRNWERFAELSIDDPGIEVPARVVLWRDWGVTEGLLDHLKGQGVYPTGKVVEVDGKPCPAVRWETALDRRKGRVRSGGTASA